MNMKIVDFVVPITMFVSGVSLGFGLATFLWIGAPLSKTETALGYACGYRDGQAAIKRQFPVLFSSQENSLKECSEINATAVKQGFTSAMGYQR